jgi:membrane-associated phospholipid phosphatase
MRKLWIFAGFVLGTGSAFGQDTTIITVDSLPGSKTNNSIQELSPNKNNEVYVLKPGIDIPVTAVGTGWSLYAFTKIYNKDTSLIPEILALDKKDIPGFDRSATDHFDRKAFEASNTLFYGSMPLPILLLLDKKIRKDAGKVGLLFLESMSVTGLLYTGTIYINDRYRPYAYNPNVPMSKRVRGGAKNSFFAGHVALVGTSTFFMAKVYSDYHPESKMRWVFFGLAGLATGSTGYLRYKAGEHFVSDIIVGTVVGTLSGVLIPHWHKNKQASDRLSLVPFYGRDKGLSLVYRF